MTSSHKKGFPEIIRGANVDGIVFCSPGGQISKTDTSADQDAENLKALENFWYNKGKQEGKSEGFEEGYKEGEETGHRKGLSTGEQQGLEQGHKEGYERGLEEGRAEKEQEIAEGIKVVKQIEQKIKEKTRHLFATIRPELIQFSLEACESLLMQQLSQPEKMRTYLEELMTRARTIIEGQRVTIHLSSDSYTVLIPHLTQLEQQFPHCETITIHEDSHLSPHTCTIETPLGLMNSDLSRQLKDLEKAVLELHVEDDDDEGESDDGELTT